MKSCVERFSSSWTFYSCRIRFHSLKFPLEWNWCTLSWVKLLHLIIRGELKLNTDKKTLYCMFIGGRNCHIRGMSHKMKFIIFKYSLVLAYDYNQNDCRFVIAFCLKVLHLYNSTTVQVKHLQKFSPNFICFPQGFHATKYSES